ncbi:MAG: glycosyltransferase [Candidatus Limivicinus sp.]|jgi:GalNAc-alpha-(1->4)-GalNAc-alpha-(1->3)-diNAcBac-PP-undecaprenol alpha-1,4-N-acetyl-D-galactosaminyltransferase
MKILFLIPRMGGGGAERVVSIIANGLCRLPEYHVKIATLVSNESFYPLNENVIFESADFSVNRKNKCTRIMSLASNFLGAIKYVRKQLNSYKPDITISFLNEMDIVVNIARWHIKSIYICSERNDPSHRNRYLQKLLEHIYKRSNMLVCQSREVYNYYSMVSEKRKIVIPNPIDLKKCPSRVPEFSPLKIVSVGRLQPQKNFPILIKSFGLLSDRFPEVTLTIYGEGSERNNLQKLIDDSNLQDRVFLPGADKNILLKIRDASIFVMSSDYEGFPNALVEAIAVGVPVISTDFPSGVAHEIISDKVGLVVPCNDADQLADAICYMLSNTGLREQIRREGYKTIGYLDTENIVNKWEAMLKKLTEE